MGRRRYTADFKRMVVVEAMGGPRRSARPRRGTASTQTRLSRWKTEAYDGLLEVFGDGGGGSATRDTEKLIERLYTRIGEPVVERDFFEGFRGLGRPEKIRLIREDGSLPLTRKYALAAVMDWASRFVLAWEIDNTLEVGFCVSAIAEALRDAADLEHRPGQPVHQREFVRPLLDAGVRISMDGRGRWIDNRFVERLWRR